MAPISPVQVVKGFSTIRDYPMFYDFADIDQAVADCESAKTVKPILRLE